MSLSENKYIRYFAGHSKVISINFYTHLKMFEKSVDIFNFVVGGGKNSSVQFWSSRDVLGAAVKDMKPFVGSYCEHKDKKVCVRKSRRGQCSKQNCWHGLVPIREAVLR